MRFRHASLIIFEVSRMKMFFFTRAIETHYEVDRLLDNYSIGRPVPPDVSFTSFHVAFLYLIVCVLVRT